MATSVTARHPAWLDGVTVSGAEMRAEILGAVIPYAGIVRGLALSSLPTPDMKVRVPAGLAMVSDGQNGYIPIANASQVDLDIGASSATQTRYDAVVAEVVDNGDATSIYRIRVIAGTPSSGTPVPPSMPPSDQPTAKTLILGTVFVQQNAESNGKVRAQDVKVTAPTIITVPRPTQSLQVTNLDNPTPVAGDWTDFTSAQWPPIVFTVPASGQAYVTVGAELQNNQTDLSNARVSFRMSGGYTLAAAFGRDAGGHIETVASRRYLVTGMTPGAVVTVTPTYRLSSLATGSNTASVHSGNLIVEPVA